MLTYRDLATAFRRLEIDRKLPVIAHVSLSSFGEVHGGAETLLGALLSAFDSLLMPTFTYKTMLVPEAGPPDNAIQYGSGKASNHLVEFFRPDMPVDRLMGAAAERLRGHPKAGRSNHPILSFAGINASLPLEAQSLQEPLAPIGVLGEHEGWVLLLGVDHRVNTSIHYAERLAGRRPFVRWALTTSGVVECPGFPGCSEGFQSIAPFLNEVTRQINAGMASIQALPVNLLVETACRMIREDPQALLCDRSDCERCHATRGQGSLKATNYT